MSRPEPKAKGGGPIEIGGKVHQLRSRATERVRSSFEFTMPVSRVRDAIEQLRLKGTDASWIVFMFDTPIGSIATDDRTLNLQYSIIDGVPGLDWVLLGERNVEDKERLSQFIVSKGHRVEEREINGVDFLRVEDGDLAALGACIATEFYQISGDAEIGLLAEGFTYAPEYGFSRDGGSAH